ncbi:helix-turn-helix domain-containing protein [Paenibacillus xerothermodurans]|uniref:AraC family transcriptional regulator n=1 Tax=Paenibacillus xerothermodurans TaxID=1977292 RepID=A0A2W1N7G1_PAEXE|nr:AraC family transcriptional regulator [Paenibacillus xerothermodurans]PZE19520.1 AraC family transcriptional regulator [Paenibacillus xerothermodurans]
MLSSLVHLGPLALLRPAVNFANRMTAAPGQEWGPRTIPDSQLIYVISGQAALTLGNEQFQLQSQDCVFYGSDSPHRLVSSVSDPCTFASIHFSWHKESPEPIHPMPGIHHCLESELAQPATSYAFHMQGHGDIIFPHHFVIPNLDSLFLQIVREYRFEELGYASVLRAVLTQLIVVIVRHQLTGLNTSGPRSRIAPALEAIRKQPNARWTAEELAGLCGYHPTYFAALFREGTGHSPKHYLVLERIRKAKQLLLEAGTIDEVAEKMGYTSIHYFCRNFKSVTGMTPSEFKRQSIVL